MFQSIENKLLFAFHQNEGWFWALDKLEETSEFNPSYSIRIVKIEFRFQWDINISDQYIFQRSV